MLTSVFLGGSLLASDVHLSRSKMHKRFRSGIEGPVGTVSIIIDKTDYELSVYDDKGWYATYPVVFGNNGLDDKKMQGDKNTPEGTFRITAKRVHENGAGSYPLTNTLEKVVKNLTSKNQKAR